MTERKQCENLSVRHEGRALHLTKAHKRKAGEGEGIGSLSNNLVYTKRQKDIHANRKHETTILKDFFTVQINNKQVDTLEQRCKHLKWSLFKNVLLTLKWGILNGGISLSRSVELKM